MGQSIRVPEIVPQVRWATLWADKGKLYLFGGSYEIFPVQADGGVELLNTTRTPLLGGQVIWEYDIASSSWSNITNIDLNGSIGPVSRAQSAYDYKNSVGYVLGGALDTGTYPLGNGTVLPESVGPVYQISSLVNYNVDSRSWTNMTDIEISLGSIQQGQMVHIGSLGTSGTLVVLGGWLNSIAPVSFRMSGLLRGV